MSFLIQAISQLSKGVGTFIPPPPAPFIPTDLGSKLLAWYDITDSSTLTTATDFFEAPAVGTTVINDKSGNGFHLNHIDSLPPIYYPNGGSSNKAYIRHGNVRELVCNTLSGIDDDITVYCVYRIVSGAEPDVINAWQFSASSGMQIKSVNGTNRVQTGGGSLYGLPNSINGNWQVLRFNYSNTNKTFFGVNNEPYDLSSYDRINDNPNGLTLLNRIGFGWRGSGSGEIHQSEMIWAKGALTSSEEEGLRRYFVNKYSITQNRYIAFFGDSITYGAHASNVETNSFPALTVAAHGKYLLNYGFPGSFVCNINDYSQNGTPLGTNLIDKVEQLPGFDLSLISHVVISFGSNDYGGVVGGVSSWKAKYKTAVQRIITLTGLPASKVIIATAPYQSNRPSMSILNTAESQICTELGCTFCDMYSATQSAGGDSLLDDGTHPTTAGHLVMYNTLNPLIT